QLVRDSRDYYPAYAAAAAATWGRMRARLDARRRGDDSPLRALEVGCGSHYPYVLLFHSAGVRVAGIDVLPLVRRDLSAGKYLSVLRSRGAAAALRRLASDALFHFAFYRRLGRAAGLPIRHAGTPL